MGDAESFLEQFRMRFRTEYICLKCSCIYQIDPAPPGDFVISCRRCGGPLCPRISRVYNSRGEMHG